jgi:hypothetical protein
MLLLLYFFYHQLLRRYFGRHHGRMRRIRFNRVGQAKCGLTQLGSAPWVQIVQGESILRFLVFRALQTAFLLVLSGGGRNGGEEAELVQFLAPLLPLLHLFVHQFVGGLHVHLVDVVWSVMLWLEVVQQFDLEI